jgi:hypothetical protein
MRVFQGHQSLKRFIHEDEYRDVTNLMRDVCHGFDISPIFVFFHFSFLIFPFAILV